MRTVMRRWVCLAIALPVLLLAGQTLADNSTEKWNAFVDEYLDKVYFPQNPSAATVEIAKIVLCQYEWRRLGALLRTNDAG